MRKPLFRNTVIKFFKANLEYLTALTGKTTTEIEKKSPILNWTESLHNESGISLTIVTQLDKSSPPQVKLEMNSSNLITIIVAMLNCTSGREMPSFNKNVTECGSEPGETVFRCDSRCNCCDRAKGQVEVECQGHNITDISLVDIPLNTTVL